MPVLGLVCTADMFSDLPTLLWQWGKFSARPKCQQRVILHCLIQNKSGLVLAGWQAQIPPKEITNILEVTHLVKCVHGGKKIRASLGKVCFLNISWVITACQISLVNWQSCICICQRCSAAGEPGFVFIRFKGLIKDRSYLVL